MTKVKIIEVCKVAPPHSSAASYQDSSSPNPLPLTFFDLLWLRFLPVQRLFFYEFPSLEDPNTDSTVLFQSNIVPRLKHSLSLTLKHFLPFAGNLVWPESSYKPFFHYVEGHDAVSLIVAETDADFHRLSGTHEFFEATEYHPLIPSLAVSHERAALMSFQVTMFPNAGFSIGMAYHHAALDGKSAHMFTKSWAHICRLQEGHSDSCLELKPLLDRTVIVDPAGLDAIFSEHFRSLDRGPNNRSLMPWSVKQGPAGAVRGTFQLTRENVNKLRELVKVRVRDDEYQLLHLSTFCLTCGYMLVCLTKAEEINSESKINFVFAVDARPRLEPPVPAAYFGNCIGGRLVSADAKDLAGEDGLVVAVKGITDAIASLETKGSIVSSLQNFVPTFIKSFGSQSSEAQGTETRGTEYSVAGSSRFETYNTDFGWGRPKKVDVVSIDKNSGISLSQSKNGDGVEVGLVLMKHHMEKFSLLFHQGLQL